MTKPDPGQPRAGHDADSTWAARARAELNAISSNPYATTHIEFIEGHLEEVEAARDKALEAASADPAIAASDPAVFEPLTKDENYALRSRLISGWYKQAGLYPLSEPWQETRAVIGDLHQARQIARQAEYQLEADAYLEPEAEL